MKSRLQSHNLAAHWQATHTLSEHAAAVLQAS
jgi:hypothetical protein